MIPANTPTPPLPFRPDRTSAEPLDIVQFVTGDASVAGPTEGGEVLQFPSFRFVGPDWDDVMAVQLVGPLSTQLTGPGILGVNLGGDLSGPPPYGTPLGGSPAAPEPGGKAGGAGGP